VKEWMCRCPLGDETHVAATRAPPIMSATENLTRVDAFEPSKMPSKIMVMRMENLKRFRWGQ